MTAQKLAAGYRGRIHILGKNDLITLCGQFKPKGWEPGDPNGTMCMRCIEQTSTNSAPNRPMPDTTKGARA